MVEAQMTREQNDDPRKLSAMIARVSELADTHSVSSVVVGVAADEGNLLFPTTSPTSKALCAWKTRSSG